MIFACKAHNIGIMKKILLTSAIFSFVFGLLLVIGGIWGTAFTYERVARENIITPADASLPNVPVRGPFTLMAQADIIRTHTLRMTDGKTFAQMPRQIPALDAEGKPMLDEDGKPSMTDNTGRDVWITANTLTTALNFAVFAYAFSTLAIVLGLFLLSNGIILHTLRRER